MKPWGRMCGCVALLVALLAFYGCASLGIAVGAPPGEKAVQVTSHIWIERPAASSLTVEVAKSSHTEMRKKGYALMGEIQCKNYSDTHDSVKQHLLRESQKKGAEVAWIVLSDRTENVMVGNPQTVTVWSGGSYAKGSPSHINYRATYLDYKYISGVATLFVRDPALAAKQMKEVDAAAAKQLKEAEERAAARPIKEEMMLLKFTRIEDAVRESDVSVMNTARKNDICFKLSAVKKMLQGVDIRLYDNKPVGYVPRASDFTRELDLLLYFEFPAKVDSKKSGVTPIQQVHDLVQDAYNYGWANVKILFPGDNLEPVSDELMRQKDTLEREKQELERQKALDTKRRKLEAERNRLEMGKRPPAVEAGKDGRFIAYSNGTVLDTKTNLMWAAKDNGSDIYWVNAKYHCESYRSGGYTDWRMPTQDELAGLHDAGKTQRNEAAPQYPLHLTELIDITSWGVWASEESEASAFIFRYDRGGWRQLQSQGNYYGVRALPVRSGK